MSIKSIQIKIALWSGLCLLLAGGIIVAFGAVSLRKAASELAIEKGLVQAREKSALIQKEIELGLDSAQTLAETLAAIKDQSVGLDMSRNQVNGILKMVLQKNDGFNAIFTVWEPEAFDGLDIGYAGTEGHDASGRFAPYWHWDEKGELKVSSQVVCPIHSPGGEPGAWYTGPKETLQAVLVDPFEHKVRGQKALISAVSVPIVANGQFYGVVGLDLNLSFLQNLADTMDLFDGQAKLQIISHNGTILAMTGMSNMVGQPLKSLHGDFAQMLDTVQLGAEDVRQDDETLEIFTPIQVGEIETPWSVNIILPKHLVFAEANSMMWQQIAVGLGLVAIALICLWLVARGIARPIKKAALLADSVAQGDLSQRLDVQSSDEVGQLAASLNGMADSLEQKAHLAEAIAGGDLNVKVRLASERDEFGKSLQTMVAKLSDIVGQVNTAAEQIASGACQVSDSSQSLSQGATEQASSLEEISSSMTEMASQTKLSAENAAQANQLANQAKAAAEQGNSRMHAMVDAMVDISQSSQNVSKIIKVIDEIAFQTNLLALNAAVEAARAGQHGKGFAVVAEEVRNLAARSAKAAQETADLIAGSVNKTNYGTQIANETAASLEEIVAGITKASDLVAEIAAASNEQANGIAQINVGLGQIDQVTQSNTANAEESAAAAEELSSQSAHLKSMLGFFKLSGKRSAAPRQMPSSWNTPSPSSAPVQGLGWDAEPSSAENSDDEPMISLDDDDFGKY